MTRIDRSTSQFMDASRWIAAVAVVLAHAAALIMIDEALVTSPGLAYRFMVFMKNIGHLAVVVFFVLSGYLVGGQELLRILDGRRFDAKRYFIQRFSRIYTVLVPALLLTMLLDGAGAHYFNQSQIYTDPLMNHVGSLMYPIVARDDPATFFGNLLMLQTIVVEPFGGDGPLWSLANEWWYYVAFGLALIAASASHARAWRLAAAGSCLLVLAMMPFTMIILSSVWLTGVGAALVARRWQGLSYQAGLAVMAAGLGLAMVGMNWSVLLLPLPLHVADLGRLVIDGVGGLAFAVAIVSARNRILVLPNPLHQTLAGVSYSLYAMHFPALVFLGAAANQLLGLRFGRPLDALCLLAIAGITAAILPLAWAFAWCTERNTATVRAALTTRFTRQPSPL